MKNAAFGRHFLLLNDNRLSASFEFMPQLSGFYAFI